jgi:hypothetical protein
MGCTKTVVRNSKGMARNLSKIAHSSLAPRNSRSFALCTRNTTNAKEALTMRKRDASATTIETCTDTTLMRMKGCHRDRREFPGRKDALRIGLLYPWQETSVRRVLS